MRKPNLFDFATGELSQDAFLCWLISWVDQPQSGDLHRAARSLVAEFYNLFQEQQAGKPRITADDVGSLLDLKRQYLKTDVYARVTIQGRMVSILIEDKTHTSHHSDQLFVYKRRIDADGIDEDETILIYFKTGYLMPRDRDAAKAGYAIFDNEQWYEFLHDHPCEHPVYTDYQDYIRRRFFDLYREGRKLFRSGALCVKGPRLEVPFVPVACGEAGALQLAAFGFVQVEFLEGLLAEFKKLDMHRLPYLDEPSCIYSGANRDGSSWMQFRFFETAVEGFTDSEYLFYRMDQRTDPTRGSRRCYFRLNQYSFLPKDPAIRALKVERLNEYRSHWEAAVTRIRETDESLHLDFAKHRNDWSGANESEVAILFFDQQTNTPENVLRIVPKIHRHFMDQVGRSGLNK